MKLLLYTSIYLYILYHDSHLRCLPLLRNYHDSIRRSPKVSKLPMARLRSLYHDSHLLCLPLLRNYHDPIRRSPIMQACWLSCAHYIVSIAHSIISSHVNHASMLTRLHSLYYTFRTFVILSDICFRQYNALHSHRYASLCKIFLEIRYLKLFIMKK